MNKGLQKPSKKKQKLFDRFLKNRTDQNEKKGIKITNLYLRY